MTEVLTRENSNIKIMFLIKSKAFEQLGLVEVSLPVTGVWNWMIFKVSFSSNHSMIL